MENERILLVDDEPHVIRALSRVLTLPASGGYLVVSCNSAEEALAILECSRFDLIVTDLRMPGMNGLALLERARLIDPEMRSILMTGFGSPQIEAAGRSLADAYLAKPFGLEEFVRTVRCTLCHEERDEAAPVL